MVLTFQFDSAVTGRQGEGQKEEEKGLERQREGQTEIKITFTEEIALRGTEKIKQPPKI
eukprot:SAG11_NODE_516_length_8817_cov_2.360977_7_plen_59_part_00